MTAQLVGICIIDFTDHDDVTDEDLCRAAAEAEAIEVELNDGDDQRLYDAAAIAEAGKSFFIARRTYIAPTTS